MIAKNDLYVLEKNAHRTFNEFQMQQPEIAKKIVKEAIKTSISKQTKDSTHKSHSSDLTNQDRQIWNHPELKVLLSASHIYRLSDATKLGDKTARILIKEFGKLSRITQNGLNHLTGSRLTQNKANLISRSLNLYHILDQRIELIQALLLRKELRIILKKDIRNLVSIEEEVWQQLIVESKTEITQDISVEEYAIVLKKKINQLFPTSVLAYQLSQINADKAIVHDAPQSYK